MSSRTLLLTLVFLFLAFLTWQIRWVLLIFFGAIVIAVILDVLIQNLSLIVHVPRTIALSVVISLLIVLGAFIFQLLVPELIFQVKELGNLLPTLLEKLKSILANQPHLDIIRKSIPEKISWESIEPVGTRIIGFAGGAANGFVQLILITLLSLLLAFDPKSHRKIIITATPRPFRGEINSLLNECRIALGGWLTGMTLSAISIFVLTWAGLAILKVPLALLCALVCGLLTFLPTIGPTTATILPLGIALIVSPTLMLEVLILRIILQNVEAFILTPLLLKRTVNLLPTVALMAQLSLGAILGLPGVLLALPLTVVLQVCIQKIFIQRVMDRWS